MNKIRLLLHKYRELLSYLVFGGLTTAVNYGSYLLLTRAFGMNEFFSNAAAWALSVLFAYVTNKIWVFDSRTHGAGELAKEFGLFVGARVFSGVMDMLLLFLLFNCLGISDVFVKLLNNVAVMVLNYFFSKFIIFRGKKQGEPVK